MPAKGCSHEKLLAFPFTKTKTKFNYIQLFKKCFCYLTGYISLTFFTVYWVILMSLFVHIINLNELLFF